MLRPGMIAVFAALVVSSVNARGQEKGAEKKPAGPTYDLKYKFRAGETIRTKVVHTSSVQTTIKGTDETASSISESVKVWKISDADPAGKATFTYSVEYLSMRGKVGDQADVMYDSRKDALIPEMYRGVAKTVGIPLATITLDARGNVLKREQKIDGSSVGGQGAVAIPLPNQAMPIGHVWENRFTMPVVLEGGAAQSIKARQRFELVSVENGVAKIGIQTQVLDPGLLPKVEVQIMQRLQTGEALFDIAAGRIARQTMAVEQTVIDFHGAGSRMKCQIRFTEEVLRDAPATAQKPIGPASKKLQPGAKPGVQPAAKPVQPAAVKPGTTPAAKPATKPPLSSVKNPAIKPAAAPVGK